MAACPAIQLPYDIWHCVSSFVSEDEIQEWYPVNRAFFCVAMNAKYRNVDFAAFDDEKMKLIKRLTDPYVARLVRALHFSSMSVWTSHHIRTTRTILFPDEIISAITLAVEHMSYIQSYTIHWQNHLFSQDLLPFLSTAWRTFRHSLRTLTIVAPLPRYQTILATCMGFEHLSELNFTFEHDNFSRGGLSGREGRIMKETIASFIDDNKGLRSLLLWSRGTIEFAPLFTSLRQQLSRLSSLTLSVPFECCGLFEPDGLARFLCQHANTLQHIEWSPSSIASEYPLSTDYLPLWLPTDGWLFSSLTSLKICLPSDHVGIFLPYLGRLAETLQSLCLEGDPLIYDDLKMLVGVLAGDEDSGQGQDAANLRQLSHFTVNVQVLDWDTVKCLSRISGLKNLLVHTSTIESYDQEESEVQLSKDARITPTLSTLSVKGPSLPPEDLQFVLDMFDRAFGASRGVRRLELDIHTLLPQHFTTIIRMLPTLDSLTLNINDILTGVEEVDGRDTLNFNAKVVPFRKALGKYHGERVLRDVEINGLGETVVGGSVMRDFSAVATVLIQYLAGGA